MSCVGRNLQFCCCRYKLHLYDLVSRANDRCKFVDKCFFTRFDTDVYSRVDIIQCTTTRVGNGTRQTFGFVMMSVRLLNIVEWWLQTMLFFFILSCFWVCTSCTAYIIIIIIILYIGYLKKIIIIIIIIMLKFTSLSAIVARSNKI